MSTDDPVQPNEPSDNLWSENGVGDEGTSAAQGGNAMSQSPISQNPYDAPLSSETPVKAVVVDPGDVGHSQTPLRWWTSLAVPAVSLLVFIVISTVMTLVAFLIVHGNLSLELLRDPESLRAVTESRMGLLCLVVVPQFALVIPSVAAAMLSPVETTQRLGLVRGHWPIWAWIAAAAATPLIGLISSVVIGSFMEESENLKMMSEIFREHGRSGFLIPLALMIGATPAICEELLFRGYVQTRLTRAFNPAAGIFIASFLFAIFHMDFVHVIAVFPLGLFLGFVTWRSGSLFPGMIGHFVNNVISVVAVVLAPEDNLDSLAVPIAIVSLLILGGGIIGAVAVAKATVQFGRPSDLPIAGETGVSPVTA